MDSSVSFDFAKIAKDELREDDTRRVQALAQFREWIAKHPAFKNYRTDDSFFLQFLRLRKFNNSQAYELFENYFIHIQKYPKWHGFDKMSSERKMSTIERGIVYPLSKRDAEGRKIVYYQMGKLDPSIDDSDSLISANYDVFFNLLEDENNQISGFVLVVDYAGFTFKHMSCLSLPDIGILAGCISNSVTARFKCIYILNLPSFARVIVDVFKMAISDKLKKRVIIIKDADELKSKYIHEKLLPKELGGVTTEAEMIQEFKETMKQNHMKCQQIMDTKVDLNMFSRTKKEESGTGSFRKLDID